MSNTFTITHEDKNTGARTGILHTPHGDIQTPVFMPVGTQAVVKTLDQTDLKNLGAEIILANTYHLHLRPGENLIASKGGLHKFMNWPGPILTDSGGFQVFSLGLQKEIKGDNKEKLVKITEDGVEFRSHLDGSKHFFTPEEAINIQHKLGADIIMAFDECTPDSAPKKYAEEAMERTHRWAKRCLQQHKKLKTKPLLFGIIQGGNHQTLREQSARVIAGMNFDGIAIGGESIGYNMSATDKILDWVLPLIPTEKARYTMGVGLSPADLLAVVEKGVDMFDCVAPTRLARHGMFLINNTKNKYRLNIGNKQYQTDDAPIDKNCACSTCQNYSRAYLHHLFQANEMTGMRLATIHNLHFMLNLMKQARKAIMKDKFREFKNKFAE
jgi:queuine tRNA-ribosyltransferase